MGIPGKGRKFLEIQIRILEKGLEILEKQMGIPEFPIRILKFRGF
jgi:hypothetical protein